MKIESGVKDEVNKLKSKVDKWFGAFQKFLNSMEEKEGLYIVVPEQEVEGATYFYVKLSPPEEFDSSAENSENDEIRKTDVSIETANKKRVKEFENIEGTDKNISDCINQFIAENSLEIKAFAVYNLIEHGYDKIDEKQLSMKNLKSCAENYEMADKVNNNFTIEEVSSTNEHPELVDAIELDDSERFINEKDASSSMKITLNKITSSEGTDINLVSVKCNYSPIRAMKDIDELLSDEEFVESIPSENTSYELICDDDDIQVNKCDELLIDPDEGRNCIIKYALDVKYFIEYIINNYRGNHQSEVSTILMGIDMDIDYMISELVKSTYSDCLRDVPYFPDLMKDFTIDKSILSYSECDEDTLMNKVMNCCIDKLACLFDSMQLYYCNESYCQDQYDSWMNILKNHMAVLYHNTSEVSNELPNI